MKIATSFTLSLLLLIFIPLPRLLAQGDRQEAGDGFVPWAITGTWNIIEGSYEGKSYEGTVEIGMGKGALTFSWNTGGTSYTGVGLELDGYVGVGWGSGGRSGIAIYKIISDSLLEGIWAFNADNNPPGKEKARGGNLSRKNATFNVSGTNPGGGEAYTGSLKLTRSGDAYDVVWKIADDTFYGVAMRMGNVLIIGWSVSREDVGVVGYRFDGDRAFGKWGLPGGATLGIENLARLQSNATPGR